MQWLAIPVALLAATYGAMCLYAGAHELMLGRPVPGKLWRGFWPRSGQRKSDSWTSSEWQRNGIIVISFGLSSWMLALWMTLVAAGFP